MNQGTNNDHGMARDQGMSPAAPPSERTRVRRLADRARYERETIEAIVDEAFFCHLGFADKDQVHVIPTACWRVGEHLYIHGSNGSRLVRALQSGQEACVNITHLDGLVLARSAFNHSMNYRSVSIYGAFETVEGAAKEAALAVFMERIGAGRQEQIRRGSAKELAATTVLRVGLAESAAKVSDGGPEVDPGDEHIVAWTGVLPLRLVPQAPVPDAGHDAAAPQYVTQWTGRRFGPGAAGS